MTASRRVGDAMEEKMSEEKSETTATSTSEIVVKKSGMTRVFDEQGNHVPVTVLELINNFIVQEKNRRKRWVLISKNWLQ